ncbi:GTP-binding protein [Streptomyces ziwulingensis]|uniref:GTP-binding protein n=1 Tax=Streptomyces ziwulingensis TaxID=1045501 RepID=UPI003CD0887E
MLPAHPSLLASSRIALPAHTLNLGILAHVDAGKTSLTERLLFENGAIAALGSVDGGDTQTDSNELERQRGITIRSAVASFALGDLQVNLVDTPGHPDFIAEVERALSVLDGAVLVMSAVEGVQSQTRVLMRSLRRLRLPTLLFVNKIDRTGARYDSLLADIRGKLTPAVVPMQRVAGLGTRAADVRPRSPEDGDFATELGELLADHDDTVLRRMVDDRPPGPRELHALLKRLTGDGLVHPVFFGSAVSGAGTSQLTEGVREFLGRRRPAAAGEGLRGTVFAVERTGAGEKAAYLRLFSGELRQRQRVTLHRHKPGGAVEKYSGRVSGLEVVGARTADGAPAPSGPLTPGNIARLRGLPSVRVGDHLGETDGPGPRYQFAPPIMESAVRSREPGREGELHAALAQLADEDPLIRTRTLAGGATSILLYGAVQKEVIEERLRREFGVEAVFERTRPVYFERPLGTGEAVYEFEPHRPNEFFQTVGVRIEPAAAGSGNQFLREAEEGLLPRAYHRAIESAAMSTLQQGLYGWEVTDCLVILTKIGYEAPRTTAADFRNLTPMVLMQALQKAGSAVYEPAYSIEVDFPADALSGVIGLLMSLRADVGQPVEAESSWSVRAEVAARLLQDVALALPGLTHGEGTICSEPGGDRRVRSPIPSRERFDGNPLDHDEYMRFLSHRALGRQPS